MSVSPLTAEALGASLGTARIGRRLICLAECDSTNDRAHALAQAGAPDGLAVFAEVQRAGRGQRGHTWLAPPGACLLTSVLLRPPQITPGGHLLTMLAACAAAAAVEAATPVACSLKWPNDLFVGDRKLAGILVETSYLGDSVEYAVLGIGLNVNLRVAEHPEIAETATSLSGELGREVERLPVARELLRQLDRRYARLWQGQGDELLAEWRGRLATLGRRVTLLDERGGGEAVVAEDVSADGALVVRRADGTRRIVRFGEVSLRAVE